MITFSALIIPLYVASRPLDLSEWVVILTFLTVLIETTLLTALTLSTPTASSTTPPFLTLERRASPNGFNRFNDFNG